MRARTVAGLLVCASCSTHGSVELVVQPGSGDVDRVALFVGVGDAMSNVTAVVPDAADGPIGPLTSFARDDHNELSQVDGVGGKEITFGLVGPADPLSMVIAVGFDANDQVVSAAIVPPELRPLSVPDHSVSRYTLALEPVRAADPTSQLDVRVWSPTDPDAPGDKNACVIAADGRLGERDAVLTSDDQDCDGWPTGDAKECVQQWFMATTSPRLPDLNCLLSVPLTPNEPIAVLGGDTCSDGTGKIAGCSPSNYCVPRSVATACGSALSCAQDVSMHNTVPTHMECNLARDQNGQLCEEPVPGFADPTVITSSVQCRAGGIHISRPSQPWGSQVTVVTSGANVTPVTLTVSAAASDCGFTITPKGPAPTVSLIGGALVAADLQNNRGVAIPYVFISERTGCGSPEPCQLVLAANAGDGVPACLASPPLLP